MQLDAKEMELGRVQIQARAVPAARPDPGA
jgi:hypothetical protein